MGITRRRPKQNSNLRVRQASYYERRSGRRAAQEPPIAATFGARGSNHETTKLGPDKTVWLGKISVGSTQAMELAAGPRRDDRALALLRIALSLPTPPHEKVPREGDIVQEHIDAAFGRLDAALDKAVDTQAGARAIRRAAHERSTDDDSGASEPNAAGVVGFPSDVADLLRADDRQIEYDPPREFGPGTGEAHTGTAEAPQ